LKCFRLFLDHGNGRFGLGLVSVVIVGGTYYQVQVDVMINEWFGQFYDMVQKALTTPNAVTQAEFFRGFAKLFQDRWHLCCYCNAAKLFLKTLGVSLADGDE
jgi:hypothetical protein